ncbi:hypothetical protein KKB55_11015 [Myxococcota bacterium]|nr:hypothetical protein [Myxococcota bacterium]MBU1898267.1 hypothetical protein [Myxococcota bacterium]
MTDLILPAARWPELPDDAAIQWGLPVVAPPLIAMASASIHLTAARARRWIHRAYSHATSYSVRGIPDPATIHNIAWAPSWHLKRVHLRALYQADPNAKITPAPSIKAELMSAVSGGSALDALEWRLDLGTLSAEEERVRPGVYRYPPQRLYTGPFSQPGAGLYVTSRPLEVGDDPLPVLLCLRLSVSEAVRLLQVDVWEAFEEAIEQ